MLNPASALSSPDWFLERFHIETGTFTLIRTSRDRLHEAAFHDGRTDLKVRPDVIHVKIEEALAWLKTQKTSAQHRIIAHTSFCGSTLLARAVNVPSHVLGYREPQVLIDLANLKVANHTICQQPNIWPHLLIFALRQFQKSWLPSQTTFIKPSNWANTLLPEISNLNGAVTYALLSMDLKAYLVANLRGGKDRLKFSLDLLNHLLSHQSSYAGFAHNIQSSEFTPLQQTLCMLALCHAMQIRMFMDLEERTSGQCLWLSKASLTGNSQKTIMDVANHFDLSIPSAELKANIAITLQYDSKMDGGEYFDRDSERNMNSTLGHAYKNEIALAVNWFETHFPEIAKHMNGTTRMTGSA